MLICGYLCERAPKIRLQAVDRARVGVHGRIVVYVVIRRERCGPGLKCAGTNNAECTFGEKCHVSRTPVSPLLICLSLKYRTRRARDGLGHESKIEARVCRVSSSKPMPPLVLALDSSDRKPVFDHVRADPNLK